MSEKQPVRLDSQNISPPKEGARQFGCAVINGVFMSPHPELTIQEQQVLREKIRSIQQRRN